MVRPCDVCGTGFDPSTRNHGKGRQRYCSTTCRRRAHNQQFWRRTHPKLEDAELRRLCIVCGVQFKTDGQHAKALTCSVKCNDARQNARRRREAAERYDQMQNRECAECGKLFKPNHFASGKAKYCSSKCAKRFRVRDAGRKRALVYGNYNKRLTAKAWKQARLVALQRDKKTCRVCGVKKKRMPVHHLFDEYDHSPDNLITVCGPCHHDLHGFVLRKVHGEVTISGKIFDYLGITQLTIKPMEN